MGFGVAIDDVGTRHSNLETVMSLRPHFIKISDVLVRGIARSTVKREMLRSLRHIAETIDAVMVAEGIEHVEDVLALRDLGLRYGQGYYMARPGPPFPTLPDYVRAELRSITPSAAPPPTRRRSPAIPTRTTTTNLADRRSRAPQADVDPAQRVRPRRGRDHERLRAAGHRAAAARARPSRPTEPRRRRAATPAQRVATAQR